MFRGNNCNLQNKLFFFGNNKNSKLMKVSFPTLTYYFLKKGVGTHKFYSRRLSFTNKLKMQSQKFVRSRSSC